MIYTDGACSGNPGPGGWGAILTYGKFEKELSGGKDNTTNNRMEMTAVIEALSSLKLDYKGEIEIWTDSKYVLQGITDWIHGWKRRGWKKADRKPVLNEDLWKQMDATVADKNITWQWIKSHDGDEGNERADALARRAIPNQKP